MFRAMRMMTRTSKMISNINNVYPPFRIFWNIAGVPHASVIPLVSHFTDASENSRHSKRILMGVPFPFQSDCTEDKLSMQIESERGRINKPDSLHNPGRQTRAAGIPRTGQTGKGSGDISPDLCSAIFIIIIIIRFNRQGNHGQFIYSTRGKGDPQ